MSQRGRKVHTSAVVLIPPRDVWEPIQAIRRAHDPQVRRWMPHVTLLYPFVPEREFEAIAARLSEALVGLEPFEVSLVEFGWFVHGRRSATVWLRPEPVEKIKALQARLQEAVPWCDDVSRYPGGFKPHLSVGRFAGEEAARRAAEGFSAGWRPLRFVADHVSLIARSGAPGEAFREVMRIVLGGGPPVLTRRGGVV